MDNSLLVSLLQNIAILLSLSMIYDFSWLKNENSGITYKLLNGIIIGSFGVVLMLTTWTYEPGIVFDTRSILLTVAGLFFGIIPTVVAIIINAAFRIYMGGAGIYMGVVVIITSGAIGLIWNKIRPNWKSKNTYIELLIIGLIVHILMLASTFLLPAEAASRTFSIIALPVLTLYPIGTMLLGTLFMNYERNWQNKKIQDQILKSEQQFKELLKEINLISILLNKEGKLTFCNNYFLKISGYTDNEVIGKNWFDLAVPSPKNITLKTSYQTAISKGKALSNFEGSITTKNGDILSVSWHNVFIRDSDQQITGTACIGENITEKKHAEQEKILLANIVDASLNEIYITDTVTDKFSYLNQGALKNLGYKADIVSQIGLKDILANSEIEKVYSKLSSNSLNNKDFEVFETLHKRADGTIYPVEANVQKFESSNTVYHLAIVQDITQRKKYEKEIITAKQKAEESDKLKSIFLANMSHEIRTPMNAIVGFSGLLSDNELNLIDRQEYVNIINNASERLLQIINDIIDISKIDTKQMKINISRHFIHVILSRSIKTFRSNDILQSNIDLELITNLPSNIEDIVLETDQYRLQQVIENLVGNAIKNTPQGSIELGLIAYERHVCIYVKDTGVGIPPDKCEVIFERFRQLDEENFHEGAGLGLSICKGIIDLLGGKIRVESVVNKGSTFFIELPYKFESSESKHIKTSIHTQ